MRADGILIGVGALLLLACAGSAPSLRSAEERDPTRLRALREAGAPRRVVLVTVAGLEAGDFLAPTGFVAGPADATRMPNLAGLAAEGTLGVSAFPPMPGSTYASHATLVTGLRPDRHGIIADEGLAAEDDHALPFYDSRLFKATTLWDAALGRGVLALGWPTTEGARIELLVPDAAPESGASSWLESVKRRSSPPLVASLEARAKRDLDAAPRGPGGRPRSPASWPTATERDGAFVDAACDVAGSERDPALWLIRLVGPATALATRGHGSPEHAEALRQTDVELGRLVDCLEAGSRLVDTALFVVGDVPFRPVHTEIAPNVALVRENLIGRDPRSKNGVRSWLALSLSHGRSAYVYAKDAESALSARRALEAEAARSGAFEVVSANDVAAGGGDRQAWFGLTARPGFHFGNALTGSLLRPAELRSSAGGLLGRAPAGPTVGGGSGDAVGFVAWGRGVREKVRMPELALVDLGPTIARLLGLRLDDRLDGRAMVGILRASQPLPPPGPKRIGITPDGDPDRALRDLGGGREEGSER